MAEAGVRRFTFSVDPTREQTVAATSERRARNTLVRYGHPRGLPLLATEEGGYPSMSDGRTQRGGRP